MGRGRVPMLCFGLCFFFSCDFFSGICRVLVLDLESRWCGAFSLVVLSGGGSTSEFCFFARFFVSAFGC